MSGPNHPRGTSNSDDRGSSETRRRRKRWLLETFGDGVAAPCAFGCGTVVTMETITVDRYPVPGVEGGRYVRGNIRPACGPCNSRDGNDLRERRKALVQTASAVV